MEDKEKTLDYDTRKAYEDSEDVIIIEEGSADFQHVSLMCGINNSHLRT